MLQQSSNHKKIFIIPKINNVPIRNHFLFLFPPAPGNQKSTFCLCGFSCSEHFIWQESHTGLVFCDCLLSLDIIVSEHIHATVHVSALIPVSWPNNFLSYGYTTNYLSMYPLLNIWSFFFHFLAVKKIYTQVFVWAYAFNFLGYNT